MVLDLDAVLSLLGNVLMNNRLTQMRMTSENVFDITFLTISKTCSCSKGVLGMNATMKSLSVKIPAAISRIHLMYCDDFRSVYFSAFWPKMLVIPMMLHQRISVVIIVDRQCTTYSELMKDCSTFAPNVPIRKPMMFTTMMTVAVNSIFKPIFMQMISDNAMVSTVSRSWSSIPAIRQPNATTACINANICIIQGSPIDFIIMSKSASKLVISSRKSNRSSLSSDSSSPYIIRYKT